MADRSRGANRRAYGFVPRDLRCLLPLAPQLGGRRYPRSAPGRRLAACLFTASRAAAPAERAAWHARIVSGRGPRCAAGGLVGAAGHAGSAGAWNACRGFPPELW